MAETALRFVDAHCHLADPRLDGGLAEAFLARAMARGIGAFIQGGVDPEDWDRQRKLAARYPGRIHCCFGLHPWWVADQTEEACQRALCALPAALDGAVGLGELGLDRGPRVRPESLDLQLMVFRKQLDIAREKSKPLILHIVRAHAEALEILRKTPLPGAPGIVHAFTGSRELARQYLELGFILSVGGPLARKGYETFKRAVASIPHDRIVIESDAPDQPPPSLQGGLNEPVSVWEVAEALGVLTGRPAESVLEASRANLERVFGISGGR